MPVSSKTQRSKELDDLLHSKTSWPVRNGVGLILLILATCVGFTWFIRYPDTVRFTASVRQCNNGFCEIVIPGPHTYAFRAGQQVTLKFRDFPFQEFGVVKAITDSVFADMPGRPGSLKLRLPSGLVTTQGNNIDCTVGSIAETEIIIRYERLSSRIWNALKKKGIAENPE